MESGIAKLVDRQAENRDGFAEMIAAEQRTYEDREWEIHRPRRRRASCARERARRRTHEGVDFGQGKQGSSAPFRSNIKCLDLKMSSGDFRNSPINQSSSDAWLDVDRVAIGKDSDTFSGCCHENSNIISPKP